MDLDYGMMCSDLRENLDASVLSDCSSNSSLSSSILDIDHIYSESLIMRSESLESLEVEMAMSEATEMMAYKNTEDLCTDLRFMDGMPEFCDVRFLVGQEKVPVYGVKAILATRCRGLYSLILTQEKLNEKKKDVSKRKGEKILKFFKIKKSNRGSKTQPDLAGETEGSLLTIEVPDIDPSIFRRIIVFVQSGTISVDISNVIGVMSAADQYGLDDLRSACYRFAQGFISTQAVLPLLVSALPYNHLKLIQLLTSQIYAFMDTHAQEILQTDEFEVIPQELATMILSRPCLRASEESKWDAAVSWSRRHSHGNMATLKTILKSFTPNIKLLEIPLSKLMEEVTPLCSKGNISNENDSENCAILDDKFENSSGLYSRKSSMSSVCSGTSSTDSGYTSCRESCML